ncbi:hypothetical protein [Blastomonas sp.]|uniref:hypothetical protein n=1 Tax=Blastomonas sp. TaxID=1909299 RepID=UPI00406AAA6B
MNGDGRKTIGTLLAASLLGLSAPGSAQDNPGSFSLPPGPQQNPQPPADVQGPVDAESTPPRRTDEPAEPAPRPPVTTIAPTPVPRQQAPRAQETPRPRLTSPRPAAQQPQAQPRSQAAAATPAPAPVASPDSPVSSDQPLAEAPATEAPPADALPVPELPGLADPDPATTPETDPATAEDDGSIWWWAGAGLIALASLVFMGMRSRKARPVVAAETPVHLQPVETVPTPPLRQQPPVAAPPAPAPRPVAPQPQPQLQPQTDLKFDAAQMAGSWRAAAAPPPPSAPPPSPARAPVMAPPPEPEEADMDEILPDSALADSAGGASASLGAAPGVPQRHQLGGETPAPVVPRLLLDYTTLGIDVTLVNAVARYHLGVTNMSDMSVSNIALHGAIVQARKGMPPTIDPMRGDSLLPHLQKIADIEPGSTQRCEGQIRLPLGQIEPIAMQGRMLFVPLVHIWIGYDGPDGTRYAVTQSFVLGEESNPPGPRVGPLRLDLGPRRFTAIGQRPLQPA